MFSSILFGGIVIAIVVLYRRIRVLEQKATIVDLTAALEIAEDVAARETDRHVSEFHER